MLLAWRFGGGIATEREENRMKKMTTRPGEDEFAPYYRGYVEAVPDGDILTTLEHQRDTISRLVGSVPLAKETYSYAEGKWSVRELLGHVTDAERVFAYRVLAIARGETQDLPSFDEQSYNEHSGYPRRPLETIGAEFDALRLGTILMVRHLDQEAIERRGVANRAAISVRALLWIMAGHLAHHLKILEERYELG